jgi:hypothetical protein
MRIGVIIADVVDPRYTTGGVNLLTTDEIKFFVHARGRTILPATTLV